MKPHIVCAQQYWKKVVHPGDTLIDATVGNGYDTLFLARLLQGKGFLIGYDIQKAALEETKKRLEQKLPTEFSRIISLKLQSHAEFDHEQKNIKLIVYNLGYLPGGNNKSITTKCSTTLKSIENGLRVLSVPGGAISVTCYPGHEEGAKEQAAMIDFIKKLSPDKWLVRHHLFKDDSNLAPSLIWIQSISE